MNAPSEHAGPAVVALGGGHGLFASLSALRQLTTELTAVVTVADDGGSSGRLRTELGALPPGDLRMALAALAGQSADEQTWAQAFQHRFGGFGALAGHPVGNLLIAGLSEITGDPVAALAMAGRVLGAVGRVLPMSAQPLEIVAQVASTDPDDPVPVRRIRGQVAVAATPGRVLEVELVPAAPVACAEAVAAIDAADWVVLGPGSWFTSVIPHLLVPELAAALARTSARKLVVLNLVGQPGETEGLSPAEHLGVLARHAPTLRIDAVLADTDCDVTTGPPGGLRGAAESVGARVVQAPVAAAGHDGRHDADLLASACAQIMKAR